MKLITKDEFYSYKGKTKGGALNKIQPKLEELEIGQGILIDATDWPNKIAPNTAIYTAYKIGKSTKRFTVKTLPDKKSWAILRLA